jgi:2-polyprenyl-6-hydroxyphenyl methylase/3-demethylubiquinone-9 3-methyltransferase
MARLGFTVVGVDASRENIGVAQAHAARQALAIDYRVATAEALLASDEPNFDVILTMEVVEHVVDPGEFLRNCARLLAPGGLMLVASLNRTLQALALAKVAAEYVLGWLPRGTHDWRKFVTPDEIRRYLAAEALEVDGPFGLAFDPLKGSWANSADASVNYFMVCRRNRAA